MNIFRKIAIDLAYKFYPSLYKKRFYKKLNNLNPTNIKQRNVEFEFLLLNQFLQPDSVFFDVGVNKGSYLYYAGNLIPQKNIFGFEPNPDLYKQIEHLFPEIHTFQMALSNTKEVLKFKVPIVGDKEVTGMGTLNVDYVENNETAHKIFDVQTDTLDNFVEEHNIQKISLIKIDVEGAEMNVIKGGEKTLRKLKPVLLIEVEERHHNKTLWNIIKPVLELGYIPHYLDRETFTLIRLTEKTELNQNIQELTNKAAYLNNFIFLPENN